MAARAIGGLTLLLCVGWTALDSRMCREYFPLSGLRKSGQRLMSYKAEACEPFERCLAELDLLKLVSSAVPPSSDFASVTPLYCIVITEEAVVVRYIREIELSGVGVLLRRYVHELSELRKLSLRVRILAASANNSSLSFVAD